MLCKDVESFDQTIPAPARPPLASPLPPPSPNSPLSLPLIFAIINNSAPDVAAGILREFGKDGVRERFGMSLNHILQFDPLTGYAIPPISHRNPMNRGSLLPFNLTPLQFATIQPRLGHIEIAKSQDSDCLVEELIEFYIHSILHEDVDAVHCKRHSVVENRKAHSP